MYIISSCAEAHTPVAALLRTLGIMGRFVFSCDQQTVLYIATKKHMTEFMSK